MAQLDWEMIDEDGGDQGLALYRTRVPGGWLIKTDYWINLETDDSENRTRGGSVCFYPDPNYQWEGGTFVPRIS